MEHVIITERTVRIEAKGMVVGKLWGGGKGYYPSSKVGGTTIEEVKKKAAEKMNDGSIDSGMGFETIVGVILDPVTITYIEIEGEIYTNKNYDAGLIQIGDVTDEEIDFYISEF